MRNLLALIVTFSVAFAVGGKLRACNLSDLSLTSVVYNSGNNTYTINVLLHVGQGKTGVTNGADNNTRTIVFAFYRSCGPMTVSSFSPSTLMAAYTGCNMPGSNLGPQGGIFNCQGTVAYIDPGYYGTPPCVNTPFGCITSTAACGNVQAAAYNLSFTVSGMPDSMRVFGVEGNSIPSSGCYPNTDMKIVFNTPMITCPGPSNFAANLNCQGILPNYTSSANVMYNCILTGPATVTQSPAPGTNVGGLGSSSTVTLTATYPNSSTVSCNFLATVADLTPPNLNCPQSGIALLGPNCTFTTPNYAATAGTSDNCTASPTVTQSPAPGTVFTGGGATNIVLTATDAAGNTTSCVFTVTRQENTPPAINCPGSQTLNLNSNCQAVLPNYTSLTTATDNCPPSPTLTQSPSPGLNMTGTGTTSVTMTATDGSGNSATCAFVVTRVDVSLPTITCPGAQTLTLNPNCVATLPNYSSQVSASDNCTSVPVLGQSPGSGTTIGSGPTTVTMTASDASGNSSTCSFTVTASDATPPTLNCPAAQTLVLNPNCVINVPNLASQATATDNCSPNIGITQTPTAGTALSGPGSNTVVLTATDAAGNSSTCTVTLTAVDQTPPTVTCPSSTTISLGTNCQTAMPDFIPQSSASDFCTSSPSLTQSPAAGTSITTTGQQTVTLTATDGSGNTSTCTLTLTVNPGTIAGTTTSSNPNPCDGQSTVLTSTVSGSSYLWSTGQTTSSITIQSSGTYWVQVTTAPGCILADTVVILFGALPQPTITQTGNQLCTGSFPTYQWYLNGALIPGATNQCINITASGGYSVVVSGSNGCFGTSPVLTIVGVNDAVEDAFQVYPVPATTAVKLKLPGLLEDAGEIRLFDLTGRAVRVWAFARLDQETTLDITGLAKGTYILQLNAAKGAGVRRVIKMD